MKIGFPNSSVGNGHRLKRSDLFRGSDFNQSLENAIGLGGDATRSDAHPKFSQIFPRGWHLSHRFESTNKEIVQFLSQKRLVFPCHWILFLFRVDDIQYRFLERADFISV